MARRIDYTSIELLIFGMALLMLSGCNTAYKIVDLMPPLPTGGIFVVTDSRLSSVKAGKSDRHNAIYVLSDTETAPDRMQVLRAKFESDVRFGSRCVTIDVKQYDIIIIAGKSESQISPIYSNGVIGGILSGIMPSNKQFLLNEDAIVVIIEVVVNGKAIKVWAHREFQGLRDMPAARRSLIDANRDALNKLCDEVAKQM
jgi:hypothetical protein